LNFTKQSGKMIVADVVEETIDEQPLESADAVGLPLPQAQAAVERSKSKGENNDV
jgi:hypothetical protein